MCRPKMGNHAGLPLQFVTILRTISLVMINLASIFFIPKSPWDVKVIQKTVRELAVTIRRFPEIDHTPARGGGVSLN